MALRSTSPDGGIILDEPKPEPQRRFPWAMALARAASGGVFATAPAIRPGAPRNLVRRSKSKRRRPPRKSTENTKRIHHRHRKARRRKCD